MPRLTKDPLLAAAHVLLVLFVVLLIFVIAMLLIGLGAVLTVGRGELLAELAKVGAPPESAFWAIVAIMLLAEAMLFAALRFTLELRGIVRSVEHGDPFEPANADRLARMGWLTVATYGLAIVTGAIAAWIKSVAEGAGDLDVDFGLGGGGIMLILVLFILARVFRQGAQMREELEGTV